MYAILCLVVGMTTVIVVYFCLNAENYLWQWTAFYSGGSTALYVFLYSIYYFVFKTRRCIPCDCWCGMKQFHVEIERDG